MRWVDWILRLFLPAEEPEEGAPPVEAEPPVESEGVDESEIERLRRENQELQDAHDARVREEAERLLLEIRPEPSYQEPYQAPPQESLERQDGEDEITYEERLARIEARQQQAELDRESEKLVSDLHQIQREQYPHMDMHQVLTIIANNPEVNIPKLCELSHKHRVDYLESYHRHRLQQEQQQAPSPEAPAASPPVLPGTGAPPSGAGAEEMTTRRAKALMAERLRSSGFRK